jgi:hypothetical protein
MGYCNPYGAENPGGHSVMVGGLLDGQNRVADQWYCDRPAVHRFRWVCDRGHRGQIVSLCQRHYLEFTGSDQVEMNLRREISVCPRCASLAPSPELQPKVRVRLESVS